MSRHQPVTEADLDAVIRANREVWDEHAEHLASAIEADTREHAASGEPCLHVQDDAPCIAQPQYDNHQPPPRLLAGALAVAVVLTLLIAALWPLAPR